MRQPKSEKMNMLMMLMVVMLVMMIPSLFGSIRIMIILHPIVPDRGD